MVGGALRVAVMASAAGADADAGVEEAKGGGCAIVTDFEMKGEGPLSVEGVACDVTTGG